MSDIMEYDVLLVGASPANLSLGLRLLELAKASGKKFTMAVLEKAREIGYHNISGALTPTHVIEKLFPDWKTDADFPHEGIITESYVGLLGVKNKMDLPRMFMPPGMKKEGYISVSISHLVRYMAEKLEAKAAEIDGVEVELFPGFAVRKPVYTEDGSGIRGVQVDETGDPESDFIHAKVVCFGEKGFVSRDVFKKFDLRRNPQVHSVGVKEVWKIQNSMEGKAWHTLGWPLFDGTVGGGWVYGQKNNHLSIGMVVSLDSRNPNIRPQQMLQDFKKHPWVQSLLKGGELVKYGAQNLPEGGWHSLPEKFALPGCIFLGDSLGVLEVSSLSGIDQAMETGYIGAQVIHEALQREDFSEKTLAAYKPLVMGSFVGRKLYKGRNFRHAFASNPAMLEKVIPTLCTDLVDGNANAGLVSLGLWGLKFGLTNPGAAMQGMKAFRLLNGGGPEKITVEKDHRHIEIAYKAPDFGEPQGFDKSTLRSTVDAVFTSETKYPEGMEHIDEFDPQICAECVAKYTAAGKTTPCVGDCTAEVHRLDEKKDGDVLKLVHGMSFENCVQCRTCELICPYENLRVNAAPEGAGPNFMGL